MSNGLLFNNLLSKNSILGNSGVDIKSIQQVSITIGASVLTNTATITEVVPANTIIIFLGSYCQSVLGSVGTIRTDLTNATTVTAYRNANDTIRTSTVNIMVVEFSSGALKSKQTGVLAVTSPATSNTATVTAVVISKSLLLYTGHTSSDTADNSFNYTNPSISLTNTTTITADRGSTSYDLAIGWILIEFN